MRHCAQLAVGPKRTCLVPDGTGKRVENREVRELAQWEKALAMQTWWPTENAQCHDLNRMENGDRIVGLELHGPTAVQRTVETRAALCQQGGKGEPTQTLTHTP